MKITTISVEAKKSRSYQTFTCALSADLGPDEDVDSCVKELQQRARKHVVAQIELEKRK